MIINWLDLMNILMTKKAITKVVCKVQIIEDKKYIKKCNNWMMMIFKQISIKNKGNSISGLNIQTSILVLI